MRVRQGEGLQDDLWLEQLGVTLGDREDWRRTVPLGHAQAYRWRLQAGLRA